MKYYKLNDLCTDIVDCPHTTPDWKNEGIRVVRNFNLRMEILILQMDILLMKQHIWKELKERNRKKEIL